jgi:hypothetical protein
MTRRKRTGRPGLASISRAAAPGGRRALAVTEEVTDSSVTSGHHITRCPAMADRRPAAPGRPAGADQPAELFSGRPGLREDHDCLTLHTRMLPHPASGMRT